MMKVNFTEEEVKEIRDIIEEYRHLSSQLYDYQKKADEIHSKVIDLEALLKTTKEEEDRIMERLHSKYGEFSLQDIYDNVMVCPK